jgi:uncharacterized membrane protein
MVKETHLRTFAKTATYRIASSAAGALMALAFGASGSQASTLGLFILFLGVATYYLHDRVWANLDWFRSSEGKDSQWRSIAKTVVYRIIVLIMFYFVSKFVLTMGAGQTAIFALVHMGTNMLLFYIVERVFNMISWGIVVDNTVEEPVPAH